MKKRFVRIALFVLFISAFTSDSFAQAAPGDAATGTIALQPAPLSFKRNNGNGTCGREAEIRVTFPIVPDWMPNIEEIRAAEQTLQGIIVTNIDASEAAQKGYVSYCISSGNILPAVKLWIKFHYEKTNQSYWVAESFNPNW